jgi:hypothetical protein
MTADPYARLDASPRHPAAPPAAGSRTGTSPAPLAHHWSGPARRCLCDCADRHRRAVEPPSDRSELVAHGADGATYDLGSWRLGPGQRAIFTSGTALTETQIKNLQITQPNGPAILAFGVPRLFRTADR